MERSVRHEDEVLSMKAVPDWLDQLLVERLEMSERGAKKGLREAVCIRGTHTEFRKLKSQEMQQVRNARDHADGNNLHARAADQRREQPVARRVVLYQPRSNRQAGLQLRYGKIPRRLHPPIFPSLTCQLP